MPPWLTVTLPIPDESELQTLAEFRPIKSAAAQLELHNAA